MRSPSATQWKQITACQKGSPAGQRCGGPIRPLRPVLRSVRTQLHAFFQLKRHAHLRVKGPAGRVAQASPLADACESESINFGSWEAIVLAVWSNRRREPSIKSILSDASAITVELHNEGVNMSATQRSTGVKYGSFAAALVDLKNNKERELKFCGDTDRLLD